jgi:hypothetical protein
MAGEQTKNKPEPSQILDGMLEMDGTIAPYYSYVYDYTATNVAYLWQQRAREIVDKKSHWQSVNREPIPGSERYRIWVPWIGTVPHPDGEEGETLEVLGGWNDVPCIYTLSQTTGEPIKPKPVPKWDVQRMLGRLGMRMVAFESQSGNLQGYSHGKEIALSPIAANPLKTIIHEAGHVALGHTLPHSYEDYQTHRAIKEYQAEGVAYVVLNLLGIMDAETARYSRGYIRHYLREEHPPEQATRQVPTVADRILKAGRVAVAGAVESAPYSAPAPTTFDDIP